MINEENVGVDIEGRPFLPDRLKLKPDLAELGRKKTFTDEPTPFPKDSVHNKVTVMDMAKKKKTSFCRKLEGRRHLWVLLLRIQLKQDTALLSHVR